MMRESMPVAELGWDGALSRAWRRIRAGNGPRSRIALSLNPHGGGRLDDDGPRDSYSYANPPAAVGRFRQPNRNPRLAELTIRKENGCTPDTNALHVSSLMIHN